MNKRRVVPGVAIFLSAAVLAGSVWGSTGVTALQGPTHFKAPKVERFEAKRHEGGKAFWRGSFDFPVSPDQRTVTAQEHLPEWWEDGTPCATGCVPAGTIAMWPLAPFSEQRPIVSGLNDSRPGSLHHGVDITGNTHQAVFAMQPGRAHIIEAEGYDARVQVGNYIYWHIYPKVAEGQEVIPKETIVGRIQPGFGHVHISEVDDAGDYVNPLRPGQIVFPGWTDSAPPVLGNLTLHPDGSAGERAYDRQSFRWRYPYITPPIGLASLGWRLWDGGETELNISFTGTTNYPGQPPSRIYGDRGPPFDRTKCYRHLHRCPYSWSYRLAGAGAPLLPTDLDYGQYRLTVYGWDWKGNEVARDFHIRWTPSGWRR